MGDRLDPGGTAAKDANQRGQVVAIRLAEPQFVDAGHLERRVGDVVFVGSDSAENPRTYQGAYGAAKAGLETFAKVVELETEGIGIRSILVRVGPTGTEFGNQMPTHRIKEILESWQYLGVYRRHHWMPAESVAKAIARTVAVPLDESYTTILDVMPGGRAKEFRS